jgi:hypothetical protein
MPRMYKQDNRDPQNLSLTNLFPRKDLLSHIPNSTLHKHLVILLMQPLHMSRHRARRAPTLVPTQAIVENTLEPKLRHALVLLNLSRHLKQAIALPRIHLPRRIPTAHHNTLIRLTHNLEMIGNQRPNLILALRQLLAVPKVSRRLGAAVLLLKVRALVSVADAAPEARAELLGEQLAVAVEVLGLDLGEGHLAQADVLGDGRVVGVVARVVGCVEDVVARGHGEDAVLAGHGDEGSGCGEGGPAGYADCFGDEAHCGGVCGRVRGDFGGVAFMVVVVVAVAVCTVYERVEVMRE